MSIRTNKHRKSIYSKDRHFKCGNTKLGHDTIIFNMQSATDCISKKLGLCDICNRGKTCYAYRDEKLYPNVLNYRRKQEKYWDNTPSFEIFKDLEKFITRLAKKGITVRYFRYNESGDFKNMADVYKLNNLADILDYNFNIITYGYTARKDLNWNKFSTHFNKFFICVGSGFDLDGQFKMIEKIEDKPKTYGLCPMDCSICNRCKKGMNTAVLYH